MKSEKVFACYTGDGLAGSTLTSQGSNYFLFRKENLSGIDSSRVTTGQISGMDKCIFELENLSSTTALADFEMTVVPHPSADEHVLITGAEWGTIANVLKKYKGALNTLAAGAKAMAYVDCGPVFAVGFRAQSAGTTVLANGTFTGNANSWTLGSGWAYGTNNVAATAASTTLKQEKANMGTPWTSGVFYEVTFTISGYSAGTLTCGTNSGIDENSTTISANGTYHLIVEADSHADGLVFTGTGFTGVIDSISAIVAPVYTVRMTAV